MDFQNNQYGIPQGSGMQYNTFNQFGQMQPRKNLLSNEDINILMKKDNSFSLALSEDDIRRARCTHRSADGMHDTLVENGDGTVTCTICGATFTPVSETTSLESIKDAVNDVKGILETIKLLWIDMNPDAMMEYLPVIKLIDKIPDLFKMSAENWIKHNNYNPWGYNNQNASIPQMFQMLTGILNGTAPYPQQPTAPQYGYGMGMPQPGAPFGMPQQPMGNPFGYMGTAPMGYQPTTDGFATQYGAPQPQPAPAAAPAPAVTPDAAATKA